MLLSKLNLEKKELKIYEFIKSRYPQLLDIYITSVSKARFMIMERMVNALLREGFLENEQIESQLSRSNQIEIIFSKGKLIIPIATRYSYNRFKLDSNPILIKSNFPSEIVHPSFLLEVIKEMNEEQEITYTNFQGFQAELSDSVANMGLALVFQKARMEDLQDLMFRNDWNSIIELVMDLHRLNAFLMNRCFLNKYV